MKLRIMGSFGRLCNEACVILTCARDCDARARNRPFLPTMPCAHCCGSESDNLPSLRRIASHPSLRQSQPARCPASASRPSRHSPASPSCRRRCHHPALGFHKQLSWLPDLRPQPAAPAADRMSKIQSHPAPVQPLHAANQVFVCQESLRGDAQAVRICRMYPRVVEQEPRRPTRSPAQRRRGLTVLLLN